MDFACPHCGQPLSAAKKMAFAIVNCPACSLALRIPRPASGYFAAPTEIQLQNAEAFEISVSEEMHSGSLQELIDAAADCDDLDDSEVDDHLQAEIDKDAEARTLHDLIEVEFQPDGDYFDLYHSPTRVQFDTVYRWLRMKKREPFGLSDVANALDLFFPEVKRR